MFHFEVNGIIQHGGGYEDTFWKLIKKEEFN